MTPITIAIADPRDLQDREEKKRLRGSWTFVSGRWPCQLFLVGDHFTVRFQNGDIFVGTYTVDPGQTPGAMEMTVEDGPEEYKGLTALCLYELAGDHLRWCPSEPGRMQRLDAFPPDEEGSFPTLVFRRHRP